MKILKRISIFLLNFSIIFLIIAGSFPTYAMFLNVTSRMDLRKTVAKKTRIVAQRHYTAPPENYEYPNNLSKTRAVSMLLNLRTDNDKFVREHTKGYFEPFMNAQNPRMTLVTCVDSRCHHHAFDKTPDNDIFMVRNLSGQYESGKASILYGVKHLETPLLVIMGHDDYGAVTAQTKLRFLQAGVPTDRQDLQKWLDEIQEDNNAVTKELAKVAIARAAIPPKFFSDTKWQKRFDQVVHQNIKFNIHRQVDNCLATFGEKVKDGKLIIAGALYDFQGREEKGRVRLIWIDARDQNNIDVFCTREEKQKENKKEITWIQKERSVRRLKKGAEVEQPDEVPSDSEDSELYVVHKGIKEAVSRLQNDILTAASNSKL